VDIACNRGLFTFWSRCAVEPELVLGDARVSLTRREQRHGLLVVDAFSSDAIPIHLITREALDLYRSRLAEDGFLAFNISNRYLDLQPVLADLAANANPPLVCLAMDDLVGSKETGKFASRWVVLSSNTAVMKRVASKGLWQRLPGRKGHPVWSDDFHNLFEVFRWAKDDMN